MSKNWLIRTKSNHILGPISKEKVLELLQNGSIKADDEVCSGNGFWFYIREDDMVSRFLLGREQQTFNPISEAKDVLTFPPKGQQQDEDITLVGGINLNSLKAGNTPPTGTYVKPLNLSDIKAPSSPEPKKKAELATVKNENLEPRKPAQRVLKPKGPKPELKKQNYLQYLAILCFLGLLALLWYRKTIFKYFKADVSFTLIEEVHAQEEAPAEKKN